MRVLWEQLGQGNHGAVCNLFACVLTDRECAVSALREIVKVKNTKAAVIRRANAALAYIDRRNP
jgi:hypothetical protein